MEKLSQEEIDRLQRDAVDQFTEIGKNYTRTLLSIKVWGETLIKLKASMPHSTWTKWFTENFGCSIDTAQHAMKIAENWNTIQTLWEHTPKLSQSAALRFIKQQTLLANKVSKENSDSMVLALLDVDDSEPEEEEEEEEEKEEPKPKSSPTMMVQLFLDTKTEPVFMDNIATILHEYNYKTLTDAVFAVIAEKADEINGGKNTR